MGKGSGDDGAVLAIGRLGAAGLLPNRAQVTARHSRTRWGKQSSFMKACKALQRCAPWSQPRRVVEAGPDVATCVVGLLEQFALPGRFMASAARDAPVSATDTQRETLISRCTEQTLRDAWSELRDFHQDRLLHLISLPAAGLQDAVVPAELVDCHGHLFRTAAQAPRWLRDRILAQVLGDPELATLRVPPGRSGGAGEIGRPVQALVRRHVYAVMAAQPALEALQRNVPPEA